MVTDAVRAYEVDIGGARAGILTGRDYWGGKAMQQALLTRMLTLLLKLVERVSMTPDMEKWWVDRAEEELFLGEAFWLLQRGGALWYRVRKQRVREH